MKFSKKFVRLFAAVLTAAMCFGSATAALAEESYAEEISYEQEAEITAEDSEGTEIGDTAAEEPVSDVSEVTEAEEEPEEAAIEETAYETEAETEETGSEEETAAEEEPAEAETETESVSEEAEAEAEETEVKEDEAVSDIPEAEEVSKEELQTAEEKEEEPEPVSAPEEQKEIKPASSTGTPVIKGEYTDDTKKFYRITITGTTLESTEFYRVKVWSKTNKTDDAKWTNFKEAEDGYEALITISDYNDPGYFYARVYLYDKTENGYTNTLIEAVDFDVPAAEAGNIRAYGLNKTAGTALVAVDGITAPSGIVSVKAVAYSKNNKSDKYEYAMKKKSDGSWKTTLDVVNHGGTKGNYKVFVYVTDGNGFTTQVANTSVDFSGTTGTVKATTNKTKNRYLIKVTNFTCADPIKEMKVTLWSENNGQDDLKTHTMNISSSGKTIAYSSYLKDFKHFGKINANLYFVKQDGTEVLYDTTSFTIAAPSSKDVTVTANKTAGTIKATAKNVTSKYVLKEVKALIWNKSDNDNKKWYTLKASGSDYTLKNVSISDFNNASGTYKVKIIAYLKNGPKKLLKETTVNFPASKGTITYADKIKNTYGKMQKNYTVTLKVPVVKNGIEKVEFAVWNEKDNKNIKWYTAKKNASGNYYTGVKILDYKKLGQYVTHVYVTDRKGNRSFLMGADIMNVTGKATGNIYLSECSPIKGTFAVTLKDPSAPSGVAGVKITAWTKDDKSDSHTYTAKKQADGTFKTTVNVANHNFNVGKYHLKATATMGNGIKNVAAQKDYTFKGKNIAFVYKTKLHHREIGINSPSKTTKVKAAVWSDEGGQDDLRWVNLTKDGLTWSADLDLAGFEHSGTFNVDFYSGNTFLKSTTFTAEAGDAGRTGWFYEDGYKFYYEYGVKKTDLTGMVGAPFQICINRECNTVTVYALDGGNGYIIPVIAMTCSVGLPGMETPTGYYYSDYKSRWEMLMGPSWGQYVTHVVEGVYIHSVAGSNTTSYNLSAYDYNNLGNPASHGCIRLCVRDAKWIYDNCPYGTEIYIYDSSYPGPFGKPETIKIPEGQNWDPTDPNI